VLAPLSFVSSYDPPVSAAAPWMGRLGLKTVHSVEVRRRDEEFPHLGKAGFAA
jgi:hypothetical protein